MSINVKQLEQIKRYFGKQRHVEYVVLFGSAFKNRLKPHSDIDFLVGGEIVFDERVRFAAELEQLLGRKVDILQASNAFNELAIEAYGQVKVVYLANRRKLVEDYYHHFYEYDNNSYLRLLRAKKMREYFSQ